MDFQNTIFESDRARECNQGLCPSCYSPGWDEDVICGWCGMEPDVFRNHVPLYEDVDDDDIS